MPSISIAMATYNGGRFLSAQLESLASQNELPLELHIGDDGSTDDTIEIIQRFKRNSPFPVHVHHNSKNLGFGENFIQTAKRCKGEWIAFCDQDDVWLPHKLEFCSREISRSGPALCLLVHNAVVVDEGLRRLRLMYDYPARTLYPARSREPDWYSLGFTQVVKSTLLTDVPSTPRPSIPSHRWKEAHDVWVGVLSNAVGAVLVCGEPLVLYRRHDSAVTGLQAETNRAAGIAGALRNNGKAYLERADYLQSVAELLRNKSASAKGELATALLSAASKIEDFAHNLVSRAAIYEAEDGSLAREAFFRLLGNGAYVGNGPWPFGPKSLIKDAAVLLNRLVRKGR